jgi:abnormal spindle-like microcephaly-associated protein
VIIERFPYKKGFDVDQSRFTVGPEEVMSLTLTWTPQDAGGCREMVLFHINGVYRLQAYVFGTVEDPKPVKKGVSLVSKTLFFFSFHW